MNSAAIYAGTFDPITKGHLDVVGRAAHIFDRLVLAVAGYSRKTPLFSQEERMEMARDSVRVFDNVEVDIFNGLLVEYARSMKINVVIRGLRAFSDFEFEFQMALTNRKLAPDIETLFLMPNEDYSYVSSSTVREVAELGGHVEDFVPESVQRALQSKFGIHA
ncbi:MAG TPA: pantetheine-phosphate adenylyltransferase [Verrucomicrobia bacterium]|nr:MAG: pantetheine-phosphate adenylyltransferase [Lentisphaerae bacterium GWF2_57_35]HBA83169.1 pantetheine-phosphate adenylyltransferase [Verrucomicrobiota bacterium]